MAINGADARRAFYRETSAHIFIASKHPEFRHEAENQFHRALSHYHHTILTLGVRDKMPQKKKDFELRLMAFEDANRRRMEINNSHMEGRLS